jgi:Zn-dependent protease with chaperone function
MSKAKGTIAFFFLALAFAIAPPGPAGAQQLPAGNQAQPAPSSQNPSASGGHAPGAASSEGPEKITAYTLPPVLYEKAKQLENIRLTLFIGAPIWTLCILWLFLLGKLGPRYRDAAERASSKLFVQVLVFAPLFVLTLDTLQLPLAVFEHWELRNYRLSVQGWSSWALDWLKGELVEVIIAFILISILYAVIRKSPRLWWLWFWLLLLPLVVLLSFVQPLVIDPLFHKFEPLEQKDPLLTRELEKMVQRAGQNIPPERMYWMNASEKVNELNAYVTGIGRSKRIVLWDTTIAKMSRTEIVAVAGHEMGHYVLHHIPKGLAIYSLASLIISYLGYRSVAGLLAWRGTAWGIRGSEDLASLPVLLVILTVFAILLTPVGNALSRHFEHQADQYSLEVTHGLTPDSGQVAAHSFQVLGEVDLEYPDPGRLNVVLTYDHPAIRDRVQFALSYDPWKQGGQGEFVH